MKRFQHTAEGAGLTPDEIAHRLDVMGYGPEDRAHLKRLAPALSAHAAEFVDGFYAHLARFEDTRLLLRSEDLVARLRTTQSAYFQALLVDELDWSYVERLLRIGAVHHRVGLTPKWYIASFNKYLSFQLPLIADLTSTSDELADAATALVRAVFFDISVALDAYGLRIEGQAVTEADKPVASRSPTVLRAAEVFGRDDSRQTRGYGIDVDADDLAERLAFTGLDEEVCRTLGAAAADIRPHIEGAVASFHALLRGGQIPNSSTMTDDGFKRLRRMALLYWDELLDANFDRNYTVTRVRVGMVHERIGVSMQWYLTALSIELSRLVGDLLREEAVGMDVIVALIKATMFDMTYIIDAYLEARVATLMELHGSGAHVLEEMTTGLLLLDEAGRIESANWAVIRLLGMPPENLKGLAVHAAVPGLTADVLNSLGGKDGLREVSEIRMLGSRRCRVRAMVAKDDQTGSKIAVLIDDLTAVLEVMGANEVNSSRFEAVVNELSIALWEADAVTGIIEFITDPLERFVTNATMRLLGSHSPLRGVVSPLDAEAFRRAWDRAAAGEQGVELEHRIRGRENTWVRTRLGLVHRGPQERARIRGDLYDVTESVRLRDELAERLAYQRSATALARRAISPDGEQTLVEDFLALLTEPSPVSSAWLFTRTAGAAWFVAASSTTAAPPGGVQTWLASHGGGDVRAHDCDGTQCLFVPLHTVSPTDAIAVVAAEPGTDLSAPYCEFAQTLVGIVSGFAGRWASDDASLQRQRLELLGTLSSSVAHDVNNVLAIIRLYVDQLTLELSPGEAASTLEDLLAATDRGAALTKDILTFARASPHEPGDTRLAETMLSITRMLRSFLPASIDLTIRADIDAIVHIRQAHLEQLVFNLASNASNAMSERGKLELSVTAEQVPQARSLQVGTLSPGPHAVICVSDSGPGVPGHLRGRVFDPFVSTRLTQGGTGLGLTAVARIATSGGGGVELDRGPLGGARFRVWVPAFGNRPAEEASGSGSLERGSSLRILVADDESQLQRLISSLLSREGHRVRACVDGTAALELIHEPFDVVICDQSMPGATGMQVLRTFLAHAPETRCILISGRYLVLPDDLAAAGARVLLKPLSREALVDAIRSSDE